MADGERDTRGDRELLAALRAEINELVASTPGPVAAVTARAGGCELEVRWAWPDQRIAPPPSPTPNASETAARPPAADHAGSDARRRVVTAPLVGTFYRAPEPGAEPFTEVGQEIEPGQDLAIVEAMKLMNPIKSEWSGTVREVLAANGQSVEFDQPLMVIEVRTT